MGNGDTKMLTDAAIRRAVQSEKQYKMTDGGGLTLVVRVTGKKLWQLRYRFDGSEKTLSLGEYPAVTLLDARAKSLDARKQLAQGIDPSQAKAQAKAAKQEKKVTAAVAVTFKSIAELWLETRRGNVAPSTITKDSIRLAKHVFPWLGGRDIQTITPMDVLNLLRRIQSLNLGDTVGKTRIIIGQVFRFAIMHGSCQSNPVDALRGTLTGVQKSKGMASPAEDPEETGRILKRLGDFRGTFTTRCLLKIMPYIFIRPGEARTMRWDGVDWKDRTYRYIATKTKTEHIVPLSNQVVAILEELKPLTSNSEWIFPGKTGKPLSDATINKAYRALGLDTKSDITGHGWRSVARTQLHERLNFDPNIIEHQLAHQVPDRLGTAYNRTKFLDQRRVMMQAWADWLDKLATA